MKIIHSIELPSIHQSRTKKSQAVSLRRRMNQKMIQNMLVRKWKLRKKFVKAARSSFRASRTYAELCARMTKTEMIIKELSTNVFMNSIRLTKPAGQKSRSLQDWRKESVPKLTKALKTNAEVIMWKLHRATLEVIYKDMGWVKGNIDNLKDMLRSLKLDRDMIILPQ